METRLQMKQNSVGIAPIMQARRVEAETAIVAH